MSKAAVEDGPHRADQYAVDVEAQVSGSAGRNKPVAFRSRSPSPSPSPSTSRSRPSHTSSARSSTSSRPHSPTGEMLAQLSRNPSQGADNPIEHYSTQASGPPPGGEDEALYARFSAGRKVVIVVLLSFCSFLAPISSTSVLAATPEVAAQYHTTGSVVNISNAVYMLMMGVSPIVWGPLSQVYGRRPIAMVVSVLFCGCSVGTALAPNLAAFFILRALTAFEGTAFLLVGSACIGDVYRPVERATAMGWFFSGTLIGPAFGPFIGGIIVTYASWRDIFWLQTALSGVAAAGTFFLLPETIHHKKIDNLQGFSARRKVVVLWGMINPVRVLKLYRYPNLTLVGLASASIVWNMYSLLTPIRYVLNPRFKLTTPILGGLFYLAPGCGYLVGTFFGGRYADRVVQQWIEKRGGERIAEDRLRSALPFMGGVIPVCMLIYGWSVEKEVGGIPLPVIVMFVQGVAQLFCFPSLNTYCLDVMYGRGAEVIAGNYFLRYLFACAGTAVVLPAVEAIGVGWFSTISALFLVVATAGAFAAVLWGKQWRDAVDGKRRARRFAKKSELSGTSRAAATAEAKGEPDVGGCRDGDGRGEGKDRGVVSAAPLDSCRGDAEKSDGSGGVA